MINQLKQRKESGFTIIEVMIVLAIAGLIMIVVFLAVPNLQRSSRNNARRNDASAVVSAASSFVSNNNGTMPGGATYTAATAVTDGGTILTDAGKLGQLSLNGGASAAAANKLVVLNNAVGTAGTAPAAIDDELVLELNSSCSGATLAAGTSRQMALLYPIEKNGGAFQWGCLSV